MKATILLVGLLAGLMGLALAQTNQPASPAEETNRVSPDTLVTKLGTVYQKFRIERVDPSGLTVSYIPEGGGIGIEKIPFIVLADEWKRRYAYDPEKAAKFDAEQLRARGQLREQMIADEQAYRKKRAELEAAEEAAAEQAKKAAEAAVAQATNTPTMTDTNQLATDQVVTNQVVTDQGATNQVTIDQATTNQPAPSSSARQ